MTPHFILSMCGVDGTDLQLRAYSRDDLLGWLRKIDHEGSSWGACVHFLDENNHVVRTDDITDALMKEYAAGGAQ